MVRVYGKDALIGFRLYDIAMFAHVHVIGIIGGNDYVVTVEMLYYTIIDQGHHPAGVLMHAIVDQENGLAPAQGRVYHNRWVELVYHKMMFTGTSTICVPENKCLTIRLNVGKDGNTLVYNWRCLRTHVPIEMHGIWGPTHGKCRQVSIITLVAGKPRNLRPVGYIHLFLPLQ